MCMYLYRSCAKPFTIRVYIHANCESFFRIQCIDMGTSSRPIRHIIITMLEIFYNNTQICTMYSLLCKMRRIYSLHIYPDMYSNGGNLNLINTLKHTQS